MISWSILSMRTVFRLTEGQVHKPQNSMIGQVSLEKNGRKNVSSEFFCMNSKQKRLKTFQWTKISSYKKLFILTTYNNNFPGQIEGSVFNDEPLYVRANTVILFKDHFFCKIGWMEDCWKIWVFNPSTLSYFLILYSSLYPFHPPTYIY